MNDNILITGVNGFAGSYLAEELIKRNYNVYGLIRRRSDGFNSKNLIDRQIKDKITLIEGDLTDISSLATAFDICQPESIFHLAAQSFVPKSFDNPMETQQINCMGTANLLEAVRIKDLDPKIVFAGSSEEYGLVISSEEQYNKAKQEYKTIFPEPENIPEVPIKETNPLRPMSPYAVSKVYGDFLMQNYYHTYGLKTVVSRAFNHEGAGRGPMFVTSIIAKQVMQMKLGETKQIEIGNINAFRDWSHVKDIINGYILLAEKGNFGEAYNQGSMRTNSVLSYILLCLEESGQNISSIETFNGDKRVNNPTEVENSPIFGIKFNKTVVDQLILQGELEFDIADKGIKVNTDKGTAIIKFNPERFRPAEVPILLSNTKKISSLGLKMKYNLNDIIKDQLNYFLDEKNRV